MSGFDASAATGQSGVGEVTHQCEVVHFQSIDSKTGDNGKRITLDFAQAKCSKSVIEAVASHPDMKEIEIPCLMREKVLDWMQLFMISYAANPKPIDELPKFLGWQEVEGQKVPVKLSERLEAQFASMIDLDMAHLDKYEPTEADDVKVLDILAAANFLKITPLVRLCALKMGEMCKGKNFVDLFKLFSLGEDVFKLHKENKFMSYKEQKKIYTDLAYAFKKPVATGGEGGGASTTISASSGGGGGGLF